MSLEAIFCQFARTEYCPDIVDENIDPRFSAGEFRCNPLCITELREVRVVDGVSNIWTDLVEGLHGGFTTRAIPSNLNDSGPHSGKSLGSRLTDTACAACDNNSLVLHDVAHGHYPA
jgi:hypothetical protein